MKKGLTIIIGLVLAVALAAPSLTLADGGKGRGNGRGNSYCYVNNKDKKDNKNDDNHYGWDKDEKDSKELRQLEKKVANANKQIIRLVKRAQATPEYDVDWLLSEVDKVVADVMAAAERIGATVECTYTAYVVDGETVLIDPLKVVNVGRG